MTLEEIQQAIEKLSPDELARLCAWLAQFEAGQQKAGSAQKAEPETTAQKLGRLAGRAVADLRKRVREP
jgi:hypothetical protein